MPRRSTVLGARLVLSLALVLAGCSSTAGKLRTRFANEHGCPHDQVTVVESGGVAYRASGCGKSTEYVCGTFASMSDDVRNCEERGAQKKVAPEPAQHPEPLDRLPSTQ